MPRDAEGSSPPARRRHSPTREGKSSRQRKGSATDSRRQVQLTPAPQQDPMMIEEIDSLKRRVITLEEKVEFLHGMLAKCLEAKPASSSSTTIADEEEEKWPVCECGNFAPRNNKWCRSCRDAWMKKEEKLAALGKGKGKD